MTRENTSVRREKSGLAGLGADKNSRILVRRSYMRLSRAWEISGSVNAYVKHHFEYETVSEPKQLGVAPLLFDTIRTSRRKRKRTCRIVQ